MVFHVLLHARFLVGLDLCIKGKLALTSSTTSSVDAPPFFKTVSRTAGL